MISLSIPQKRCLLTLGFAFAALCLFPIERCKAQSSTTGVATGKVVNAEGDPLIGAVVLLTCKKTGLPSTAITNEEGIFQRTYLDQGWYEIKIFYRHFEEDELSDFWVNLGDTNPIKPHPPIFTVGLKKIAGQVFDSQGNGMPNLKVVIKGKDVKLDKNVQDRDKTDREGKFTFKYLRPGKYDLVVIGHNKLYTIPTKTINDPEQTHKVEIRLENIASTSQSRDSAKTDVAASNPPGSNDKSYLDVLRIGIFDPYQLASVANKKMACQSIPLPLSQLSRADDNPSGQTGKATLKGQVVDSASKGVSAVTITALDESKGNVYATLTTADGYYAFANLSSGSYTLSTRRIGYRDEEILNVQVQVVAKQVDIKLTESQSGPQISLQENIRIEALDDSISWISQFGTARRGNFTGRQINALPLGGTTDMRTFDELAFLIPGVSPPPYTPGIRGPGIGFGIGTPGKFSVNGMRARSNNFSVDGSDDNDPDVGVRRQGFVALVPQSIESINEFQILTLLWDAELGRNFGAQVNVVSKYGGNDYRGQIYGFMSDSKLNARNFFNDSGGGSGGKDPFTRTQAGFIIEGPIVRNNTQFFGSFEHQNINASSEQHFATPTIRERRFLGLPRFRILPISSQFPPNFFFDTDLGAIPLGQNFLSFYPIPNNPNGPYGENTFSEVLPSGGKGSIFSIKITKQIKPNHALNVRYNFTNDNRVLPSVNQAIHSTLDSATRTQNISIIYASHLASTLFNQARFSYGRTHLNFSEHSGSPFIFSSQSTHLVNNPPFGDVPFLSKTGDIGEVIIEPFSPVGVDVFTFPQGRASNTFQYADSVSSTRVNHLFKFGSDIHRVQLNSRQDRNYRPLVIFGNGLLRSGTLTADSSIRFTPSSDPDRFLPGVQLAALGLPSSVFQTLTAGVPNSSIGLRFNEIGLFFNDSWQARQNLTFDYGMRYEYNTILHEVNNRIERNIKLENLPRISQSIINTNVRTSAFNAAINAYRLVLDGRTSIYNSDKNNFGPHIGFAWDPQFDGKTIVRGGYGIYYDAVLGAVVSQSRNVFPNEIPINIDPSFLGFDVFNANLPSFLIIDKDPSGNPIPPIPLITPGTLNQIGGAPGDFIPLVGEVFRQALGGGLAFTLPAKKLPTPFAQQWHLTLDRELFNNFLVSAAYVGTKGSNLTRLTTPNLGPNVTPRVPFALTSPVQPVNVPFVITNLINLSLAPARPTPSLGPYQIFENSGNSNYHALQLEVRKRYSHGYAFTMAYTWSHALDDVSDIFPIAGAPILPQDSSNLSLERASANFDIRHRFTTSLIWDLPFYRNSNTGIARWLGGWQIASIFQANTGQPFTLNLSIDANLDGNLTDRPSTVDGLVFFHQHGPRRAAISPDRKITDFFVFGQDGFVGRNTVRGDSFVNWDLAVNKFFQINERQKIELRTEFFNFLNRANFGLPIRFLDSPGFGSSVDTINPARIIQFAVKYSF